MNVVANVLKAISKVSARTTSCGAASHVGTPMQNVCTLGMLVHIHLTPHTPHLISPGSHIPSLMLGTSCVAFMSVGGSKTVATHGVPVAPPAVGVRNDVSAVAFGGVGVGAKFVTKAKSATSTSSCQLPCVDSSGGVVDAVAKTVRKESSAAPTTSPCDPSPLVPSLGCRRRLSLGGVAGNRNRERRPTSVLPGFLMPCSSCPPGLLFLGNAPPFPPFLLPALLVIAFAEALVAACTP